MKEVGVVNIGINGARPIMTVKIYTSQRASNWTNGAATGKTGQRNSSSQLQRNKFPVRL